MKRPGPGEGVIPVSLIIIMMIKMKGDEVTMLVGKPSIFGLYLDKVKAVKGCRQVLIGEGITPADLSFKAFFQEMFFFC